MAAIIVGTTPTIKYTFSSIDPENIVAAYLTIKKGSGIVLEKNLSDAVLDETGIMWALTQSDTLAVGTGDAKVMLNWLLTDGTRGASAEKEIRFAGNHKPEVI